MDSPGGSCLLVKDPNCGRKHGGQGKALEHPASWSRSGWGDFFLLETGQNCGE